MNDYQDLLEALNLAIRNINKAMDIEQRISHNAHRDNDLSVTCGRLKVYRDAVTARKKRIEVMGQ